MDKIPLKDINNILTPDMENVNHTEKTKTTAFYRYEFFGIVHTFFSVFKFALFGVGLIITYFFVWLPLYNLLK